jgi:hypothetical protein
MTVQQLKDLLGNADPGDIVVVDTGEDCPACQSRPEVVGVAFRDGGEAVCRLLISD